MFNYTHVHSIFQLSPFPCFKLPAVLTQTVYQFCLLYILSTPHSVSQSFPFRNQNFQCETTKGCSMCTSYILQRHQSNCVDVCMVSARGLAHPHSSNQPHHSTSDPILCCERSSASSVWKPLVVEHTFHD